MMKYLQKLGKALMLPVAALPVCGILMGIYSRKRPVLAPGEMETVRLKAELLQGPGEAVTVTLEEG